MAATAVYPAMNGDKLFPVFTKAPPSNETNGTISIRDSIPEVNGLHGAYDDKPTKPTKARRLRKKQISGQKTLQEIVNPKAISNDGNDTAEGTTEPVEEELSPRCSKRRRTSRTDSNEIGGHDEDQIHDPQEKRHSSPQVIIPSSSPLSREPLQTVPNTRTTTPPKKMLRLRAGGKFSSPVSKKADEASPEPVKKRGRPRKAKEVEQERKCLVAVVNFDVETDVGVRIDRILAGDERYKRQVKIIPKQQRTSRKAGQKSSHPFFSLDRRKEQPSALVQASPHKVSAVTPGKLRRELNPEHVRSVNEVVEIWTSALLKDRLMFKHPGAKEPAWPDSEQVHVRGLSPTNLRAISDKESTPDMARRKRKAANKSLSDSESLLRQFASHIEIEKDGEVRADGFREPHPSLRLPARLIIPGKQIAKRVATQLSISLTDADVDKLSHASASQQPIHAALLATHNRIINTLSAFDEGKGEAVAWTQKCAPLSCDEVLQSPRQTKVLRDWLVSLKVTTVEIASRTKTAPRAEPKPKKRKRRRKDEDLDEFLVDSDEEVHDMDELTDPEDLPGPSQGRKSLNSIVQVAAEGAKLSNAVLLSGPLGCGKTAAAYAVAKELGYKVFEISSSERRSGKDVLDKVGDMTENHLVKHHGIDSGEQSSTEEPNVRLDEAFQRDLASGRQGKMASFFKPQVKSQPKKKTLQPKETVKTKAIEAVQNVLKKPPKDQQQSLILLEEVDVLFKEDKDFWTTVLKLITTSKRPFIMTCNDEDLVPLQAMSLHALLRFTPPPVDLATDYLLLVAAAEGHLLEREAVSSLYCNKNSDLRAAISELDLWCQMGVGDPQGGLSWIFQRYPPGSDLDEQGRRLRVVSERTYKGGMGLSAEGSCGVEDKLLWASREHSIDASTALGWETLDTTSSAIEIKDFCKFADHLSSADVYASAQCTSQSDTTQKPMNDNERSHYIEGLPLLQTDEQADYSGLAPEILATSTLFTFRTGAMLSSNDEVDQELDILGSRGTQRGQDVPLPRQAFACFDNISIPAESALSTVSGLQHSVFDGPLEPIATDIAPYVRSIVHFDQALAEQREALGGGKAAKRARTTRTARSAFEGGQRASTRRERWFPQELNFDSVLATGGEQWPRMVAVGTPEVTDGEEADSGPASSAEESI